MLSPQAMGQVRELAAEVSVREGVQLYDVEFVGRGEGTTRILRVYVDNDQHSVTIDDCANVSQGLSLLLDVEDLIPGNRYDLEVSTPGLNRVLSQPWHFEKAIGEKVKVRTNAPVPGTEDRKVPMKAVKGQLMSFENEVLTVEADEQAWKIPLNIVHRANVIYEFETPKKPSGKKPKGKNSKR